MMSPEEIGRLIRFRREQFGFSQTELAGWIGVHQAAMSRIEAGRQELSASEYLELAEKLVLPVHPKQLTQLLKDFESEQRKRKRGG